MTLDEAKAVLANCDQHMSLWTDASMFRDDDEGLLPQMIELDGWFRLEELEAIIAIRKAELGVT